MAHQLPKPFHCGGDQGREILPQDTLDKPLEFHRRLHKVGDASEDELG